MTNGCNKSPPQSAAAPQSAEGHCATSPSHAAANNSRIGSAMAGVIGLLPPPPPPPCQCQRHAAAAATALLPPLTPPCRLTARHRQAAATASNAATALPLPPLRCQRCRKNCPPLPLRCCATSAALPMLPPCIQRYRLAATAIAMPPPPPPLYHRRRCCTVTLLPHCSSPPPLHCRRRPHAANASAALPVLPRPSAHMLRIYIHGYLKWPTYLRYLLDPKFQLPRSPRRNPT
jgi:hypothetical protein